MVRQKLAQAYVELEIFRLNANRALSRMSKGCPGPEGSILKLCYSEQQQRMQQTAMEALGPYAQLQDFGGGRWFYGYLRSRGATIAAGTSKILRNILAERVVGLLKSYIRSRLAQGHTPLLAPEPRLLSPAISCT